MRRALQLICIGSDRNVLASRYNSEISGIGLQCNYEMSQYPAVGEARNTGKSEAGRGKREEMRREKQEIQVKAKKPWDESEETKGRKQAEYEAREDFREKSREE